MPVDDIDLCTLVDSDTLLLLGWLWRWRGRRLTRRNIAAIKRKVGGLIYYFRHTVPTSSLVQVEEIEAMEEVAVVPSGVYIPSPASRM